MAEDSPASKRVKVGTDEDTAREAVHEDVAMGSSPTPGNATTEDNAVEEEDAAMEDAPEEEDDMFTGLKVQQLMKQYYGQIFPFEELFTWLAYGNDGKHPQADKGFSQRREICFTLQNDIFVRYQSYKSSEEMRKGIMGKVPAKIDIGPVYSVDPQRRAAYASGDKSATSERIFVPVERELVFDIDLTDYDDVRSCGKEGHICVKCWPLMALAVQVMDKGLRDDFGFRHILWVFSGRRGIHCWVCDQQARQLTDEQRAAVANYFSIYKGTENGMAKLMVPTSGICPPSVERALEFIRESWEEKLLPEQGLLEDRERWLAVLRFFDDVEDFGARLDARWAAQPVDQGPGVSATRWQELEAEVAKIVKGKDAKKAQTVQRAVKEVMVAFAYPRLDVEVSKKMNHLLKAPFCVHPKTGKVCVPMDPEEVWDFNPEEVPTVHQLLREAKTVQKARKAEGTKATGPMWEETSMAPCMHLFDSSFLQPLLADCQQTFNEKARQEAAKPTLVW